MKHVKTLSTAKPAVAEAAAWVQLKDLIGSAYAAPAPGQFVGPGGSNLQPEQTRWLATQWDNLLQK
jgi:hypothetical protein